MPDGEGEGVGVGFGDGLGDGLGAGADCVVAQPWPLDEDVLPTLSEAVMV
jgi:hypothetical protein